MWKEGKGRLGAIWCLFVLEVGMGPWAGCHRKPPEEEPFQIARALRNMCAISSIPLNFSGKWQESKQAEHHRSIDAVWRGASFSKTLDKCAVGSLGKHVTPQHQQQILTRISSGLQGCIRDNPGRFLARNRAESGNISRDAWETRFLWHDEEVRTATSWLPGHENGPARDLQDVQHEQCWAQVRMSDSTTPQSNHQQLCPRAQSHTQAPTTHTRAGALTFPSSCLDGSVTRVGSGQYPHYTRAPFAEEAVGSSQYKHHRAPQAQPMSPRQHPTRDGLATSA